MKLPAQRWQRWLLGSVLTVAVLGAGYYGAKRLVWPGVKAWRIARMNREASAYLASGDLSNAMLTARKSLKSSSANAEAWRIAAATAAARNLPEAVWYQDNLCREEPTKANQLQLIRLALRFEVPNFALGALKVMAQEPHADPEFYRLAAQVYTRTRQPHAAESSLQALVKLQPSDHVAQLDLAEIELAADPERKDPAVRARVLALAAEPALAPRALTLLLRDNVAGKVTDGTAGLVSRLQLLPGLGVADRLLVIQGLALLERPEAASQLAQLQAEVADQPADVARVVEFFTRTGRAELVRAWVETLPAATGQHEEVRLSVAEALLTLHDAPALEAWLRGGRWAKREYLRQALLAHAYRDLGRSAEFAEAWRLALMGTGSDLRKDAVLLARVDGWQWVNERHDVVWKFFAVVPSNESIQEILIGWERHQGNTANLNRLFARISEIAPKDAVARNNFAYTSLLLDANVARASQVAADLVAAEPGNAYYTTTLALALYKRGHAAEALARLDTLTTSQRTEPVRMLIRALCLAGTGQAAAAAELLNGTVLTGMLPEEIRLADAVVTEVARLDRVQGNRTRLLAFHQGQDRDSGAAGWLVLVDAETRRTATTDMKLADSLYAAPDWAGLRELLRTTSWEPEDYLRRALRAYVFRRQGDALQSAEEWRQALALADRSPDRLQNLRALATTWKWPAERLATLNLIFARTPGDRRLLAELLQTYREARKTADLNRVLTLFIGDNTDPSDEAVANAYYSLLLDTNVARAHVAARNAFEAAQADPVRRIVYAFSLWKQRRAAEAMPLLAEVAPDAKTELLSIPLVRAIIQTQMGAREAAQASLARFQAKSALPEEVALAATLSGQLSAQAEPAKPPQT